MWFGFQFNSSDSSDDDLYRLDLDPEGQGFTGLPPVIKKKVGRDVRSFIPWLDPRCKSKAGQGTQPEKTHCNNYSNCSNIIRIIL